MFDYIPEPLRSIDQWLVWKTKNAPTSATNGRRKDWPENLATFDQANEFCLQKSGYRLGFAFTPDSEIIGIDLDSCRNPDTGEVESWAMEIIKEFATYTEVSESGTGLKLIGLGHGSHRVVKFPSEKQWGGHEPHFEFFANSKYFALTGNVFESFSNVVQCLDAIKWLDETFPEEVPEDNGMKFTVPEDYSVSVEGYNQRNPIIKLLTEHGYQLDSKGRPVRPGKDPKSGHSATIDVSNGCERVTFWSSNCHPFEQATVGQKACTYDAWAVNVFLNYDGDFPAAKQAEFENGSVPKSKPKTEEVDPDSILPYQPFPTDSLPECAKTFVRAVAKQIDCDEANVALPLISAMSASIGNSARLEMNYSYIVPAVIWTCIVAPSGSGKSPPWKLVRNLFASYDEKWNHEFTEAKKEFDADEKTYKKQFAKWKVGDPMLAEPEPPRQKRILTSDITIEKLGQLHADNPKGLFVCVDELAGWLSSFDRYGTGTGNLNQWIELHGGLALVQDRKVSDSAYVAVTSISIAGTIQPERFFGTIGAEGLAAGLAGRLAVACPPSRVRKFNLAGKLSKSFEIENVIQKLLLRSPEFNENEVVQPATIQVCQVGREVWKEFFDEKHRIVYYEHTGPLTSAIPKLVDMALRFALVFHLFKNPEGFEEKITVATIQESIEVAEFFIHEANRLYLAPDNQLGSLCQLVLETLSNHPGERLSVRDLQRKRRALRKIPSDEIGQACNQLVSLDLAETETEGTTKPKIVYFVPERQTNTIRF